MYIFISYSDNDSNKVTDIIETLEKINIEYFAFRFHIRPGQMIDEKVRDAIKKTTHMLIVVSQAAQRSNWVWYEVGLANGIKMATGRDIVLIPYKTDNTIELPDFIHSICAIESLKQLSDFLIEEKENEVEISDQDFITHGDRLNFHGFETSVNIIDFCKTGYKPTKIQVFLKKARGRRPPKNLKREFDFKKSEWENRENNREIYDHHDLIGLKGYALIRNGLEEDQGLELNLFTGSYVLNFRS